ncbi:MAG: DUF167 domain-containing protein [Chloroflexi bacterium]|nr:DUF167 domain-containing protein [Chloroflexota bacterium]
MVEEKTATIMVRVQPNARQNKIVRFAEGVWYIRIAAPAIEGKANETLVKFLGDALNVSKTSLSIKQGMRGRQKVITVSGLTQEQVTERMESRMGAGN